MRNANRAEQNRALVARYQNGDEQAAEELLALNERLISSEAWRWARNRHTLLEVEDLQQEARLGLLRAARMFDPSHDVEFSTVALVCVRRAVQRAAANDGRLIRLPVGVHDAHRPARNEEHPRWLPDALSLDAEYPETEASLLDIVADEELRGWEDRFLLAEWVDDLLDRLPPLYRATLIARFDLDGQGKRACRELAETWGKSRQWWFTTQSRALDEARRLAEEEDGG